MEVINRIIIFVTDVIGWFADVLGTIFSNPILAIIVGGLIVALYLIFVVFRD